MDWSLQESREFLEKFEVVRKKNRIEAENCLVNLEKYKTELEAGHKPQNIHRGFLHSEQAGVWAIAPTGVKGTRKKTIRLYVFPDEVTSTLFLLTIGDKGTQSADIKSCATAAREIIADNSRVKTEVPKSTAEPPGTGSVDSSREPGPMQE